MKDAWRVLILYPVLIGLVCGTVAKLASGWSHGDLASFVLGLLLSFLVWFPFALRPYLMRRHSRK